MGNGTITEDELIKNLVSAKKIMNKVDSGQYEKGRVNKNILLSDPSDLMEDINNLPSLSKQNKGQPSIEKINQSKLPDEIKKAMIERPIIQPDISLTESLDLKLVEKAKKLMKEDGTLPSKQTQYNDNSRIQPVLNNTTINEIVLQLTPIIENTIRKVLDEKLTQLLTAKETTSINENLLIKVGDSLFKGKITGVKSTK